VTKKEGDSLGSERGGPEGCGYHLAELKIA
jgi:hypothetical protein